MLKATHIRQYRKRETGKMVFVSKVTGTPEEIAEYVKSKGEFARKDEKTGDILLFSNRFNGESVNLIKTEKGEFVADTTENDKLANLTAQYGIDVAKQIMAKQEAEQE